MLAANAPGTLEVGQIVISVLGGLALFLYGLDVMTGAVKAVAGGGMRALLARVTKNRFKAAFTGAFVTAVIQSSSVTTVLVVGFISAGLLTLEQSIGIIMGANIGSTVTAQIVAFKVTHYALLMIAIGYGLSFILKSERPRLLGSLLLGLGLLFLGMNLMSEATSPLRTYEPFIGLMARMDNPLWGVLLGTLFTALIQSSAATTGIVIVLAGKGLITLEAGIALALGANIGTCATAILASLGRPREARQAAVVHILFNIIGVVLWVGLIDHLASFVRSFAGGVPRQIANAHTVFNVANTLLFIWFTKPLAGLVRRLVPDRPPTERERLLPKYLDSSLLGTPEFAIRGLRMEIRRLGGFARGLLEESVPKVLRGSSWDLSDLSSRSRKIDALYAGIVEFAGKLHQSKLTSDQTRTLSACLRIVNHVQNVSETIRVNLVALGRERIERGIEVSEVTTNVLEPLRWQVVLAMDAALSAFSEMDPGLAEQVREMKHTVNEQSTRAKDHLAGRLTADLPNREWTFRLESDLVENLKRLYYFSKRIAREVIGVTVREPEGE